MSRGLAFVGQHVAMGGQAGSFICEALVVAHSTKPSGFSQTHSFVRRL